MTNAQTTEEEMVEMISFGLTYIDEGYSSVKMDVETFQEAGLLTNDNGLVVMSNGKKFQITVTEC